MNSLKKGSKVLIDLIQGPIKLSSIYQLASRVTVVLQGFFSYYIKIVTKGK